MVRFHHLMAVLVSLAATAAGCADPYAGRVAITGTVKLAGQPLQDGSIQFIPLDEKLGTQSGAAIVNGQYGIPRESGLKPGQYLVRITSGDGKTPANEEDAGAPGGSTNIVSFDRIPGDWNVNSEHHVEVKASGPDQFDFDIPKARIPKPRR